MLSRKRLLRAAQVLCAALQLFSVNVCVDRSSPSAAIDERVARAAFATAATAVRVVSFDGANGVVDRYFRYLASTRCALVMGIPVEPSDADAPRGLELTRPYASTGYVLATLGSRALRKDATIAVEMGAPPSFYLVGALGATPPYKMETYPSEDEAIAALYARADAGAMVWYPSLLRYEQRHAAAPAASVTALTVPHARWELAAFYDPKAAREQARTFERGIAFLRRNGRLTALTGPHFREK